MKIFPKTVDSQFLVRVIQNEVSQEEKEFFESWLHESEKNKEEFGNLILLWDKASQAKLPPAPDASLQFRNIMNRIRNGNYAEGNRNLLNDSLNASFLKNDLNLSGISIKSADWKERLYEVSGWTLRIAAAMVILFMSYYLFSLHDRQPVSTSEQNITPKLISEKVTYKGERSTITLSDGTTVYLNSNSRLIYPKIFNGSVRQVELIGEAYFSVAHDKTKPFIVSTGSTLTEVLGTEFNLRYRSNNLRLVVAKGAVKAYRENSDRFVRLTKGQMVSFSPEGGFTAPKKVNTRRYTAWRENKLSFVHAQLYEVMNEIEMYYNVQVVYENKFIKNKKLTGIFDADSLDRILSMLSLAMDMNIYREGKKVIVN